MKQILVLIIQIGKGFFEIIFEILVMIATAFMTRKKEYDAQFIRTGELLSSNYTGFCLTGTKNLSKKLSYQNAMVVGGTGTGKSSVVLIPSVFSMEGSFIINDPSGELYTKTSGYLERKGYVIKVLNFARPEISTGYNPVEKARTSSEIQKLASILVETSLGGKGKDPFWNTQATALITMLISILKKQDPQYQNLYNVRQLLNRLGGDPKSVDDLFIKHAGETLFAEYKSFISYDDKVVSGVVATCKAALQIFNDEAVAGVTSTDNLDFSGFRQRPTALYIQNSVADQKYYSVLTSILFEQFFSYILSRFPAEEEQDVFLLIDEAPSLNLPTLPLAVANVRKHRSGIMLLMQDFSQLVHNYGKNDAEGIKSNCFAKMYFTGTSLETSKELEQILGKFQYEDDKKHTVIRPLMTNDEIRTMSDHRAILICGNRKPILAHLTPCFRRFKYRRYINMPSPNPDAGAITEEIPLLPSKGSIIKEKEEFNEVNSEDKGLINDNPENHEQEK